MEPFQCFLKGFWVCSIIKEIGYTGCSSQKKCVALEEANQSLAEILAAPKVWQLILKYYCTTIY